MIMRNDFQVNINHREPRQPGKDREETPSADFDEELPEHRPSPRTAAERQSILELTRELARLPLDQAVAALEMSASIAGVSLRASIEFLRAAPEAAHILDAANLPSWGEPGRPTA